MKLKGFLAYSIKYLRELYAEYQKMLDKGVDYAILYWNDYYAVLSFVADYYGIDRWNFLDRLVHDPEVEV